MKMEGYIMGSSSLMESGGWMCLIVVSHVSASEEIMGASSV